MDIFKKPGQGTRCTFCNRCQDDLERLNPRDPQKLIASKDGKSWICLRCIRICKQLIPESIVPNAADKFREDIVVPDDYGKERA